MVRHLVAILLLVPSIAVAAPTATAVTGTVNHGQNIVISGTGFGSKATAAPAHYDDFERTPLTTAATIGAWTGTNGMDAATVSRNPFSHYAAHKNFVTEGYGAVEMDTTTSRKWFVNMWVYLSSNWDWGTSTYGGGDQMLSNIKYPVRFWRGSGNPNIYNSFGWGVSDNGDNNVEFSDSNIDASAVPLSKNAMTKGQWHQIAQEFVDVSAPLHSDCEWRLWFDGRKIYDRSGFDCNDANGAYRYPLFVGFYNAWGTPRDTAPNDYYMDDVYVDTTLQRVELCDSATRATANHCEVQLPVTWSDTGITASVNQGSFAAGSSAYLYVFDASGTASTGYPVTIGGTPTTRSLNGRLSGRIR